MKFSLSLAALLTQATVAHATSNQDALVEHYQKRAAHALQALLSNSKDIHNKNNHNRLLQSTVNCDTEAVNDWVTDHVEGGRCEDFNTVVGGVELCRQYERYTDPVQCLELPQNQEFSIGSGQMEPSQAEQCMFFVNHLLPHPYFLDLDSILPVFGSGFDFPIHHECEASQVHECQVDIQFESDQEFFAENETLAPTMAPFTETVPCTRCDFYYESDDVCFEADCGYFNCEEPTADTRSLNRTVEVCFQNTRSDLFSFTEHRLGEYYGCSVGTEEKLWTTEFHKGVTNIRHIQFRLGEHRGAADELGLDFCELSVDGVLCNECIFCGNNDTNPHIAIDCENIIPGASTSCDSQDDFLYGISRKLMTLQEGFTLMPTNAPTISPRPTGTATPPPTNPVAATPPPPQVADAGSSESTVTQSDPEAPEEFPVDNGSSEGFEGGIGADQLEGVAESAAANTRSRLVVVFAVLVGVIGFF